MCVCVCVCIVVARRAPGKNLILFCPLVYNLLKLQCETGVRLEA